MSQYTSKPRINFVTNPDSKMAGFLFLDENGNNRMFVGDSGEDAPLIRYTSADGKSERIDLYAEQQGKSAGLTVCGSDGQRRVSIGWNEDGSVMQLYSKDAGTPTWQVWNSEKANSAGLIISDSKAHKRLALGIEKDEPYIQFYSADGKTVKEIKPDADKSEK